MTIKTRPSDAEDGTAQVSSIAALDLRTALKVDEEPDGPTAWHRLERLGRATEHRLISLHAGSAPDPQELARSLAPLADLVERNVDVRVVCTRGYARPPHIRAAVADLMNRGVEVRFTDSLPHRLLIADGSTAAAPLKGSRLAGGAAFIRDSLIVEGLELFADRVFRWSVPLAEVPSDGSTIGPSRLELRVVRLMATGFTDEVAARHLRVTDRQYRRYVAATMKRLGATSRFQAGVLAKDRGWL